jgi:hypothetical protein
MLALIAAFACGAIAMLAALNLLDYAVNTEATVKNDPRILPYWKVVWLEFVRSIERRLRPYY